MLYLIWHCNVSRQSELWRRLDVSRTTVSRMLAALEKLGLVWRGSRSGPASRYVGLTEEGRTVMQAAYRGCHRPMLLLFESHYPGVRKRLDRAAEVDELRGDIVYLAMHLGDRSRLHYTCNAPEDVWHFTPEPPECRQWVPRPADAVA